MVIQMRFNIGSGNGLSPDGTKPLPEPIDSSVRSSDIHLRAISQKITQPPSTWIRLKIDPLKFHAKFPGANEWIHWGRVTHISIGKLTIIGSDNGLLPGQRQVIIWTNAGILSIGPLGTNFSEILIVIQTFSFNKMHLKMTSVKWWLFVSASTC